MPFANHETATFLDNERWLTVHWKCRFCESRFITVDLACRKRTCKRSSSHDVNSKKQIFPKITKFKLQGDRWSHDCRSGPNDATNNYRRPKGNALELLSAWPVWQQRRTPLPHIHCWMDLNIHIDLGMDPNLIKAASMRLKSDWDFSHSVAVLLTIIILRYLKQYYHRSKEQCIVSYVLLQSIIKFRFSRTYRYKTN